MKIHIQNCRGISNAILIYGAHLNPNLSELMFHDTCGWATYDDEKTRNGGAVTFLHGKARHAQGSQDPTGTPN